MKRVAFADFLLSAWSVPVENTTTSRLYPASCNDGNVGVFTSRMRRSAILWVNPSTRTKHVCHAQGISVCVPTNTRAFYRSCLSKIDRLR
jgi:hypothetical protein